MPISRATLCVTLAFLSTISAAQSAASKPVSVLPSAEAKQIVAQARNAYYNLEGAGFAQYRCQFQPDWDAIFAQLATDELGREKLLPILKQERFYVAVGPEGASSISRQLDIAPPSEAVAERLRTSVSGMDQTVTGFLKTWELFGISSPFPSEDSAYEVEDRDGNYRVTYKEAADDVTVVMNHDLKVTEFILASTALNGDFRITTIPSDKGLLFAAYDADVRQGTAASQHVSAKMEYGQFDGWTLLSAVKMATPIPSGTLTVPIAFTNCEVKRKN
jgi:hypothetical protein